MEEKKIVKRQLLKNMIYTFITFTIIFTIFDLIIYNMVNTTIYQSADQELNSAKSRIEKNYNVLSNNLDVKYNKQVTTPQRMQGKNNLNPRVICIVRNQQGIIINKDSLGRFYNDYIKDTQLEYSNLNQINVISLNENYSYRVLNFKINNSNRETEFIQLLVNVDAETQNVENILETLIITTIIMILISIIASYILSKQTLKPIIDSWNRQTEFVQNASHELRTPLTIIEAKQELLLQEPEMKIIDKSKDINICINETRRLSKLIKELMELARADSNNLEIKKEKTNIDKLIKDVSEPYIEMAKLQEKNLELDLNIKNEKMIDKSKISELMVILLDNAIKYTTKGDTIKVSTKMKDSKVLLEVSDTGIGISQEGLKHIFERFYRDDKARSREKGGTGLGLSIAQAIVEAHNGTIKLINNGPKGTKVIIKL